MIAGEIYHEHIIPFLKNYWLPLKGKALGEWIPELNRLVQLEQEKDPCKVLHMLFNGLPRLDWTRIGELPYDNGIYIMFEKGQHFYGMDRIVRVGTHRAQDRLLTRLKDHFVKEDAEGSIFRKNIGRVILAKSTDPYLKVWELNYSNSKVKASHGHLIDEKKETELEAKISSYLRDNISFVCFPVETEVERLRIEEGIISTLNKSPNFRPTEDWLGLYSPVPEITASGLWNRQGLSGQVLSEAEVERVKALARFGNGSVISTKNQKDIRIKTKAEKTEQVISEPGKKTANEIRQHIDKLFQEAKERGDQYLDLVSGQIHNQLGMKNSMPQVCRIMYEKKQARDEIMHTTPSGKSSTIKIRYFIN